MTEEQNQGALSSAADEVAERRRIKNPDDVVGVCVECKSTHDEQWMAKNPFAQAGHPPSCRYCGGVVIVTYAELQGPELNAKLDQSRGIGSGHVNLPD